MKNIHLLPTDKPSRLSILNSGKLNFGAEIMSSSNSRPQNLYITNDEEIKEGDWVIYLNKPSKVETSVTIEYAKTYCKKIILTTDQDLIKDGVQSIDDEFLEWFVKNPSCEEVEIEDWYNKYLSCCRSKEECYCNKKRIIIPKDESKQTSVNWFIQTLESDIKVDESNMVTIRIHEHDYIKSKQVALEMEKKQIIESYDQGDIQLVNAEQYFDKTYK
jgi:hypothetical protein